MDNRIRLIGATEAEVSAINEVLHDLLIEAMHDGVASVRFNGFDISVKQTACGQYRTIITRNNDIVMDVAMQNPLGGYAETH